MQQLIDKTAIVTGGSRGIGAEIARALAAAGASVVVSYVSDAHAANGVVTDIRRKGGNAVAAKANLAKHQDIRNLFDQAEQSFGVVSILVNNAGIFEPASLNTLDSAEFYRHFDVNVLGMLLAIQEASKRFENSGGSIINIGSVASCNPLPESIIYAASKGAVDSMTRALSIELGPRKIRVNVIAPGPVATDAVRELSFGDTDVERNLVGRTPLGRIGLPEDIARVAVFLASADSNWITGERIVVSGGLR